jgi:hypothetical protein
VYAADFKETNTAISSSTQVRVREADIEGMQTDTGRIEGERSCSN